MKHLLLPMLAHDRLCISKSHSVHMMFLAVVQRRNTCPSDFVLGDNVFFIISKEHIKKVHEDQTQNCPPKNSLRVWEKGPFKNTKRQRQEKKMSTCSTLMKCSTLSVACTMRFKHIKPASCIMFHLANQVMPG